MIPSSFAILEILLHPWIGAADDDEVFSRFTEFDPNDKERVIAVVRTDLLPGFLELPAERRDAIMRALVQVQSSEEYELERFWESMLPPFSLPDRHQDMFCWISEALSR